MTRRTIVILSVLCAGVVARAQPQVGQTKERQLVADWVGSFEKTHQVEVTSAEEQILFDSINQAWAQLAKPAALPPNQATQYEQFIAGAIVRGYLSQMREGGVKGKAMVTGISAGSFRDYIFRLQTQGDRPKGELVARSTPSEAPVTVDGTRDGNTESTSLMSPGGHTVVISPSGKNACSFQVMIEAGRTQEVHCK